MGRVVPAVVAPWMLLALMWHAPGGHGQAASGGPAVDAVARAGTVDLIGCDAEVAHLVTAVLRAEFGTKSLNLRSRPRPARTTGQGVPEPVPADRAPVSGIAMQVQCRRGFAALRVRRAGAEPLVAELSLDGVAREARARLIAVTLSELVVTSGTVGDVHRVHGQPMPERASGNRDVSAPDTEPRYRRPSALRAVAQVMGGVTVAAVGGFVSPSIGLGAKLPIAPLWLLLEGRIERGSHRVRDSDVTLWVGSGLLAATLRHPLSNTGVQLSGGLGVRGGYLSMGAEPDAPQLIRRAVHGWFAAPALVVGATGRLGAVQVMFRVTLDHPLGRVVGLDADRGSLFAYGGAQLNVALGLGL